MSYQYLDKAGATLLVSKVKDLLNGKINIGDADKNVIESVSVNGTALPIVNKNVDVTVPTTLESLTGDETHRLVTDTEKAEWSGKQAALVFNTAYNASTNKAATMQDVTDAVGQVTGIKFEVVKSLPTTGVNGTIYLMSNSTGTNDLYDEYIYVSSKWEKIGNTNTDLTDYLKKTDLTAIENTEIEAMFLQTVTTS